MELKIKMPLIHTGSAAETFVGPKPLVKDIITII